LQLSSEVTGGDGKSLVEKKKKKKKKRIKPERGKGFLKSKIKKI